MKNFKPTLSMLQWILILSLALYIIFLKQCRKCPPTQTITVTKILPSDTVYKELKVKFPVPILSIRYDTVWKTKKIDTLAILKDYFCVKFMRDSIKGDEIKGTIEDSIYQNNIKWRKVFALNTRKTTINTTIVNNWKNSVYVGFSGYFGTVQGLGLSGQYVTKNWSAGGGYDFINRQIRGDFELNLRYIFSRK